MGGGAVEKGWHKFQCKLFEGGGQNFSASFKKVAKLQTFEGHPEATKIYIIDSPH